MDEPTTSVGAFLRRERERRGITLRSISEQTKVSVPLLEGLEADDLSRWPGGIFRRAFVRGYATSVGLDPDEVIRRVERQHKTPEEMEAALPGTSTLASDPAPVTTPFHPAPVRVASPRRVRLMATAGDLTVAVVLGLGSAAAGSRMLWPVLMIAAYYALGTALTGSTPMVALLGDDAAPASGNTPPEAAAPFKLAVRKGRSDNVTRESRAEMPRRRRHGGVSGAPRAARS